MRAQLFGNLLYVDIAYINRRKASDLLNALVSEAQRVRRSFLNSMTFVALLLETTVYLVLALVLSWPMVLATIGLIGVVLFVHLQRDLRICFGVGANNTRPQMRGFSVCS